MLIDNILAGIVLTAQSFNPTIFTETWLNKNNIVKAESLEGDYISTTEVAQFQTKEIQVLVMPPRMQITFNITRAMEDSELPFKIAKDTLRLLQHTPYQSLGLNFDFHLSFPEEAKYSACNRALLGSGDSALINEFASDDARFGRYFSKDYDEFRLRLNIMPVVGGPEKKDMFHFAFNFNHDVGSLDLMERADKLSSLISKWETLRAYADRLVNLGTTR